MESPAEVEDLRERDQRRYGNPDGPTFDQLVKEGHAAGLQDDEAYERIIQGAQTTNRGWTSFSNRKGRAHKARPICA